MDVGFRFFGRRSSPWNSCLRVLDALPAVVSGSDEGHQMISSTTTSLSVPTSSPTSPMGPTLPFPVEDEEELGFFLSWVAMSCVAVAVGRAGICGARPWTRPSVYWTSLAVLCARSREVPKAWRERTRCKRGSGMDNDGESELDVSVTTR